jgi:hypothetical protein
MEKDQKITPELTCAILNCCFEVMKELGPEFLEKVYENRDKVIGRYHADLFVGKTVILELKCL